jgi:hypothetical protein
MNESPSGASAWQTRRSLNEPVLESVEAELGAAEPQPSSEQPGSAHGLRSKPGNGIDTSGQAWWMRMQQQLTRQVSQRPAQSALLALGVGAVLVALLGRSLRRSSRRD